MSKIIISGVGFGMSCSIARKLKEEGNIIGIVSRGDNGKNVAEKLGAFYSRGDLTVLSEVRASFADLSARMGGVDAVVHLAGGFYSDKNPEDVDENFFNSAMKNNATSFYNAVQAGRTLFPPGGGAIIAISASRSVYMNSHLGYAAGKGAIDYMVRLLAKQLAPLNIRVNAVAPGFIAKDNCGESGRGERLLSTGRHDGKYVADAVNLLLNNKLATGQILEVDAGFSSLVPGGFA